MEISTKQNDNEIIVSLKGKFTFADREQFHEVAFLFPKQNIEFDTIELDCKNLDDIDASGVGMFLVLHENAAKKAIILKVTNISGKIKRIFQKSALGNIFKVYYIEDEE